MEHIVINPVRAATALAEQLAKTEAEFINYYELCYNTLTDTCEMATGKDVINNIIQKYYPSMAVIEVMLKQHGIKIGAVALQQRIAKHINTLK
jgi:hypothetical protein